MNSNGSPVATYGYDANGNRVSVNGTSIASFNADDQLTAYNGVPYTYALDGSLAGVGSTTYRYDALGHLLEVKTPAADITYTYDGLGRRVGKSINGTLVQGFLYANGINPIAQLDGLGNVVATFVYGTRANVPDLMLKGGVTYRIISNELGSPVEVVNTGTGAIVEQVTYDPWGNITSDSNPGFQPFGFAGGLVDADTGLVHFGARDYDPVTGRWTTRDPLSFGGGDANLYGYVVDDPINGIDPYGEWTFQIGFSFSYSLTVGGVGVSGSLGFGAAFDGHGDIGTYTFSGKSGALGTPGLSGGVQLAASNADTICQLAGPFNNVSLGGGWGPDATGDGFWGQNANGQTVTGAGLTLGAGIGADASVGRTDTTLGPIGHLW